MENMRPVRRPEGDVSDRPASVSHHTTVSRRSSTLMWIVIGLILALLIIGLVFKVLAVRKIEASIKKNQYQAVFLINGQVYFGKLSNVTNQYVEIKDIYYLQVQQTVQPKDQSKPQDQSQNLSLAKLGGELHGPEDIMYIARQQVLFWENLKDDGKVVKAIKDNQKK